MSKLEAKFIGRDNSLLTQIADLMIRAYENPLVSLNTTLLNSYFWGGYVGGGWFISHKSESYSGVRGTSISR